MDKRRESCHGDNSNENIYRHADEIVPALGFCGGRTMRKQKEMVESFQVGHKEFMQSLMDSITLLEHDIDEAKEVDKICTSEWCIAIERSFDELAKDIYSISEPRWASSKQSDQIREIRNRLHNLYGQYQGRRSGAIH